MSGPARQQLGQSDDSEGRMFSAPLEVLLPQIPGTQFGQVFRPQTGKFIQ